MDDGVVLIVEDEPLILMDLEFAVEDAGRNAVSARTLDEGLSKLDQFADSISIAILDVSLPGGKTCVPIAERLRDRSIPFVLHSGDLDRTNEVVRGLKAELISKPADPDAVVAKALALAH